MRKLTFGQAAPYTLVDHTADLAFSVTASTLPELFETAALALTDLTVRGFFPGGATRKLSVEGEDLPDLLVNFLREVLFLFFGEAEVVCGVEVEAVNETSLEAKVLLSPFLPGEHRVENEIKAVTWHDARVERAGGRWTAAVLLDV